MKTIKLFISILLLSLATGCAHRIVISPDISQIERNNKVQKIPGNAGYYFTADSREKEVITPGGGGDKVSYFPYRDIEAALYKMLSDVFADVAVLKSGNDDEIKRTAITYVIAVDISTNSSSPSLLTWPPTVFGVNLICEVDDPTGKQLKKLIVSGEGKAEFDEFKRDFGLAGKRASQDAILKMEHALLNAPELRSPAKLESPTNHDAQPAKLPANTQPLQPPPPGQTLNERLTELKKLYDAGLITKDVYESRQRELLNPK